VQRGSHTPEFLDGRLRASVLRRARVAHCGCSIKIIAAEIKRETVVIASSFCGLGHDELVHLHMLTRLSDAITLKKSSHGWNLG
jgi:hypothetical protein